MTIKFGHSASTFIDRKSTNNMNHQRPSPVDTLEIIEYNSKWNSLGVEVEDKKQE